MRMTSCARRKPLRQKSKFTRPTESFSLEGRSSRLLLQASCAGVFRLGRRPYPKSLLTQFVALFVTSFQLLRGEFKLSHEA